VRLSAALHLVATAALAQVGPLAPSGAPASAFPKPDRPVAEIISPIWASEKERDAVDEAGQLVRRLGIAPGMNVADIGAGSGYHTVRLARAVGPAGQVFGQDVLPRYLAGLTERVGREGLTNVTMAQGDPHDPRLPPRSVDVAILVHMYHEIAQPFAFLHNLMPALRPGARVGVVDLDRPTDQHGTPRKLLACEFAAVGYRQIAVSDLDGNLGYLAVFAPPDEAERIAPSNIIPCATPKG
jgi:SAM-dependent methyltransferase